jgi:hypothetical protein
MYWLFVCVCVCVCRCGPIHYNEYKIHLDGCLLGCRAVYFSTLLIALIMEAARSSETLVNFYQTTRRYSPEDSHLRSNRRENLKSYIKFTCIFYMLNLS